jgi:hypothetical protein
MLAAICLAAPRTYSQTLDFTLNANSTDGKTVVPKLTWATTPAATSCTGSGGTGWAGTKAASGTQTLAAVSSSQSYVMVCNWPGVTKAVVTWTAPTTNSDGSAYTDAAGFHVLYGNVGPAEAQLTQSASITDPIAVTWTSPDLTPAGTWYFGLKAVNAVGLESILYNVAQKTVTAAASQSRTLGLSVKMPNPPVVQ